MDIFLDKYDFFKNLIARESFSSEKVQALLQIESNYQQEVKLVARALSTHSELEQLDIVPSEFERTFNQLIGAYLELARQVLNACLVVGCKEGALCILDDLTNLQKRLPKDFRLSEARISAERAIRDNTPHRLGNR